MLNDEASMPSATLIRSLLLIRVEAIQDEVLVDLPTSAKVSLAIDCWTSPNCLAFMAVTGYFIDANWQYQEVLLGFEHVEGAHYGHNLAGILQRVLSRHEIRSRLLAITTDNASNNGTLAKELEGALTEGDFNAKGGHIPCLAHVIQLSLKELLGKIRVEAENEEVIKTWKDESLSQLQQCEGISQTLAKV